MNIKSEAFSNGKSIPIQYTCDGENIQPPLLISDAPKGTKSFALIMDDPDSSVGIWTHWLLWNIPPDTKELTGKNIPQGSLQGETTFGTTHYGGPCPKKGNHRYFFKLYALDSLLNLPAGSKKEALIKAMKEHILGEAELYGWYESRTK